MARIRIRPAAAKTSIGLTFLLAGLMSDAVGAQNFGGADPNPEIRQLSDSIYAVGKIRIDRDAREFALPGTVLRREPPLEYLAVVPEGIKGYESLLELDATAYEFNIACILIGLEGLEGELPDFQFDTGSIDGPRVSITGTWVDQGVEVTATAAEMLWAGQDVVADDSWVYTGSAIGHDGRYWADSAGTLIGFVHDPNSIIEHVVGLGIGNYGLIGGNFDLVPEEGTPLTLRIRVSDDPAHHE